MAKQNEFDDSTGAAKVAGEPYQNPRKVVDKQAFSSILEQKQNDIKVSHHAQKRLTARELTLQDDDYQSLSTALSELAEKAAKNHCSFTKIWA